MSKVANSHQQTKSGRFFITGFSGTELSSSERAAFEQLQPAGVIFFAKNFVKSEDWRDRFENLLSEIRSLSVRKSLLVSIDHEGGRVHRFAEPVTHFPAAVHWEDSTTQVAEAMACELKALGFNLCFAPVLDVLSETENKVIGDRAFSSDPQAVAARAIEFAQALEAAGILSCGKHFPGHGGTWADSHKELPVLENSLTELEKRELAPFQAYIQAGFETLMVAHLLLPEIDPRNPASLSRDITTGLLREQLGYRGLIITDDLEMNALSGWSIEQRSLKSFAAGSDLLLIGNHPEESPVERALRAAVALDSELRDRAQLQARFEESAERVHALEQRLGKISLNAGESRDIGCSQHSRLNAALRSN